MPTAVTALRPARQRAKHFSRAIAPCRPLVRWPQRTHSLAQPSCHPIWLYVAVDMERCRRGAVMCRMSAVVTGVELIGADARKSCEWKRSNRESAGALRIRATGFSCRENCLAAERLRQLSPWRFASIASFHGCAAPSSSRPLSCGP